MFDHSQFSDAAKMPELVSALPGEAPGETFARVRADRVRLDAMSDADYATHRAAIREALGFPAFPFAADPGIVPSWAESAANLDD